MKIATTTYSAYRGYAWSRIPDGITQNALDTLYRMAAESRPDFASESEIETGVVGNGIWAGAYSIRRVPAWDAEGRASDYGAFALFPYAIAAGIDMTTLLRDDFFTRPSHTPPTEITYEGPRASEPPLTAAGHLLCRQTVLLDDARCIGTLLQLYGPKSNHWRCRITEDGKTTVTCDPWIIKKD